MEKTKSCALFVRWGLVSDDMDHLEKLSDLAANIFRDCSVGLSVSDAEGRFLDANPAYCAITGYSVEELRGKTRFDITYSKDVPMVRARVQEALKHGEGSFRLEKRYQRPDGQLRWVKTTGSVSRAGAGEDRVLLVMVTEDITAQRQAEEQVRMLASAVAHAGDAIAVLDGEQREPGPYILFGNEAFGLLTGISTREAAGRGFCSVLGADGQVETLRGLREAMGRSERWRGEVQARRRDGAAYLAALDVVPVPGADGEVERFAAVLLDVTEARRTEADRRHAAESALAAKQAAEEQAELKEQFLATMSHELRTPIYSITLAAEALAAEPLSAEGREHAALILRSSEDLQSMVTAVLDFSQFARHEVELREAPFSLTGLLRESVERFAGLAAEKELEFHCDYRPGLGQFLGDRARLRQAVDALLSNAVKFTTAGHVLVRAEAQPASGGLWRISVTVEDSGEGFDASASAPIFDGFRQADATNSRRHGGLGLSLALAKRILEAMGGQIFACSEKGSGSVFRLLVDLRRPEGATDEVRPSADRQGTRVAVLSGSGLTAQVLCQGLEREGYRPVPVSRLEALWDLLKETAESGQAVSAVIADQRRMVLDRENFLADLAALSAGPATGCVFLDQSGAHPAPAPSGPRVETMAFPIDPQQLFFKLDRVLAARTPAVPETSSVRAGSLAILLAEDNVVNQKIVANQLRRAGHRVRIASNGREAVEMWSNEPVDLILMDCQMPELDGYDATRKIRGAEVAAGQSPVPILALTANAMSGDRQRCIDAGMTGYLTKPITAVALLAAIASFGSKREAICPVL